MSIAELVARICSQADRRCFITGKDLSKLFRQFGLDRLIVIDVRAHAAAEAGPGAR